MADDNLPAKSFLLLKNRQLSILQQKFFSFFPKATLKVIQLESHHTKPYIEKTAMDLILLSGFQETIKITFSCS